MMSLKLALLVTAVLHAVTATVNSPTRLEAVTDGPTKDLPPSGCPVHKPALRFRTDRTFTILQLTDMHLSGPETNTYGQDEKSVALMNNLIQKHKPDLVVLTGDLTHGWCCHPSQPGLYHGDASACFGSDEDSFDWSGAFAQAVRPMNAAGVPYMISLGNHDYGSGPGAGARARGLIKEDMEWPCSYTQQGPMDVDGVTNYHVEIMGSAGDEVAAVLTSIDTMAFANVPRQMTWYVQSTDHYRRSRGRVPSLVFQHIAPPEAMELYNCSQPYTYFCQTFDAEDRYSAGLMAFLYESALDVLGLFVGHHHDSNNCGSYNPRNIPDREIAVCLTRSCGYCNQHGPRGFDGYLGGRLIVLREGSRQFSTVQVFEEGGEDVIQAPPYAALQQHGPVQRYIAPCTISGPRAKEYNSVPCEWRGGRE